MKEYKITFTGSVSVGKTTLVKALSELPKFKGYHIATERSKYLNDLGIKKENLVAKGYGETSPIAPNTLPNGKPDLKGMQQNRRVEMKIVKQFYIFYENNLLNIFIFFMFYK